MAVGGPFDVYPQCGKCGGYHATLRACPGPSDWRVTADEPLRTMPLVMIPHTPPSDELVRLLKIMDGFKEGLFNLANIAAHPAFITCADGDVQNTALHPKTQELLDLLKGKPECQHMHATGTRPNLKCLHCSAALPNDWGAAERALLGDSDPPPDEDDIFYDPRIAPPYVGPAVFDHEAICARMRQIKAEVEHPHNRVPEGFRRISHQKPSAAIYDMDAIRHRAAQLRGEAPSGRYFRQLPRLPVPGGRDGRVIGTTELVEDGHDWDYATDRCARCRHTAMGVMEGFAPKVCPGKVTGERCIECGENAVQTAQALGAQLYKVWCLSCGHSVWNERGKPVQKQRALAKTPAQLGHTMVDGEVVGGTFDKTGTVCNECLWDHTFIVNHQKQCDGIPF